MLSILQLSDGNIQYGKLPISFMDTSNVIFLLYYNPLFASLASSKFTFIALIIQIGLSKYVKLDFVT